MVPNSYVDIATMDLKFSRESTISKIEDARAITPYLALLMVVGAVSVSQDSTFAASLDGYEARTGYYEETRCSR